MTKDTGASKPVGTLRAIVLDVNDMESCAGFWSVSKFGVKIRCQILISA